MLRIGGLAVAGLVAVGLGLGAFPLGAELSGHGGFVKGVAVSSDGRRVLSASFDYTLKLWDLDSQSELLDLNEHEGAVNGVAFLPRGQAALSASDDGTVRLWDLETGRVTHTFEGHTGTCRGGRRVTGRTPWGFGRLGSHAAPLGP